MISYSIPDILNAFYNVISYNFDSLYHFSWLILDLKFNFTFSPIYFIFPKTLVLYKELYLGMLFGSILSSILDLLQSRLDIA